MSLSSSNGLPPKGYGPSASRTATHSLLLGRHPSLWSWQSDTPQNSGYGLHLKQEKCLFSRSLWNTWVISLTQTGSTDHLRRYVPLWMHQHQEQSARYVLSEVCSWLFWTLHSWPSHCAKMKLRPDREGGGNDSLWSTQVPPVPLW